MAYDQLIAGNNLEVHLMVGPPGCGKSRYIRTIISAFDDRVVISRDAIHNMLHSDCYHRLLSPEFKNGDQVHALRGDLMHFAAFRALQNSLIPWIDACHMTKESRSEIIRSVKGHMPGTKIFVHDLWGAAHGGKYSALSDHLDALLAARMTNPRGVPKDAWAAIIAADIEEYEPPTLDEGIDEIENIKPFYSLLSEMKAKSEQHA